MRFLLSAARTRSLPHRMPVEAPAPVRFSTASHREAERLHIPAFNEGQASWFASLCRRPLRLAYRPGHGHARDRSARLAACAGVSLRLSPHSIRTSSPSPKTSTDVPATPSPAEENLHCIWRRVHARPAARLRVRYLPTAFYQTNPQQTELLYQLAIDGMDPQQATYHGCLLR